MQYTREELELSVPFDPNAMLGTNQTVKYSCVRCLLESTAARQDDQPGRSEAIRRLVEIGLKAKK
jgi:hypothetical protein